MCWRWLPTSDGNAPFLTHRRASRGESDSFRAYILPPVAAKYSDIPAPASLAFDVAHAQFGERIDVAWIIAERSKELSLSAPRSSIYGFGKRSARQVSAITSCNSPSCAAGFLATRTSSQSQHGRERLEPPGLRAPPASDAPASAGPSGGASVWLTWRNQVKRHPNVTIPENRQNHD